MYCFKVFRKEGGDPFLHRFHFGLELPHVGGEIDDFLGLILFPVFVFHLEHPFIELRILVNR